MKVLGISALFHDSAAALVIDGEVVAAAQEERFSRIKHDKSLPIEAAKFCLEHAGLEIAEVDYVVFYEKPLKKMERILVTQLENFPRGASEFVRSMGAWLSKKLWLKGDLLEAFEIPADKLLFSEHHLSHAASAFLTSPFDDAITITVDGVGEWATTSVFECSSTEESTEIDLIRELHFPHSIGLVYSALTAFLGFEVNSGEYKVMGLASYGTPRYLDSLRETVDIGDAGELIVDDRFYCYHRHPSRSFTPALEELLGSARVPESPLKLPAEDDQTQRFADIAASIQALTEEYLVKLVRSARAASESRNLCLAGGVALNAVANSRILQDGGFENVYVQPAAGDAGGAVGAALWADLVVCGTPRRELARPTPFLGPATEEPVARKFLEECRVPHLRLDDESLCLHVADLLARGDVGGWFQGRFEWGPRALGARSIIADPRRAETRDRVNAKIKYREAFRPFAPSVLAEEFDKWFELPHQNDDHLTPFMTCVARATGAAQSEIPAVVHTDGTARVQTVSAQEHPRFHALISSFKAQTGVGVLLNTSMNLKDEPICATPAEAYATFLRSDLDFLVIENCVIDRRAK